MSLRPLVAGPSRSVKTAFQTPLLTSSRNITIPHPDLTLPEGRKGSTHFSLWIQSAPRMDMYSAFKYIKAAEKALGQPIINVQAHRDQDSRQILRNIDIVTLRPVEITNGLSVEVKFFDPPEHDIYGGPGLDDVLAGLNEPVEEVEMGQQVHHMSIEVSRKQQFGDKRREKLKSQRGTIGHSPNGSFQASRNAVNDFADVLDVLEDIGGEWEQIASRYQHVRRRPRSKPRAADILSSNEGREMVNLDANEDKGRTSREDSKIERQESRSHRQLEINQGGERIMVEPERSWNFEIKEDVEEEQASDTALAVVPEDDGERRTGFKLPTRKVVVVKETTKTKKAQNPKPESITQPIEEKPIEEKAVAKPVAAKQPKPRSEKPQTNTPSAAKLSSAATRLQQRLEAERQAILESRQAGTQVEEAEGEYEVEPATRPQESEAVKKASQEGSAQAEKKGGLFSRFFS